MLLECAQARTPLQPQTWPLLETILPKVPPNLSNNLRETFFPNQTTSLPMISLLCSLQASIEILLQEWVQISLLQGLGTPPTSPTNNRTSEQQTTSMICEEGSQK